MNGIFYDTEAEHYDIFDDGEGIDFSGEDVEGYYYDGEDCYEPEAARADFWPDELEAFEMTEADYCAPEGYVSDIFTEYEPDIFDNSAELAEGLRKVLHEDYQDASPEELQEALFDMLETMRPAEGINFGKVLGQIRKDSQRVLRDPAVGKVASTVLPYAGAAVGSIYAPGVGTALGGKLGQVAGQALSGGRQPRATSARPKAAQVTPQGGSAAARQLLELTRNSDMLSSLLALALGSHGRKSIEVGQSGKVALGGFANLLAQLASQAAADADELLRESDETYAYLLDSEGNLRADPANPGARAQRLYEVLSDVENQRLATEAVPRQPWSVYFPFAKGTKFLVEYEIWGPDLKLGRGIVLERTSQLLKVRIHIDKWSMLNIPETDAVMAIEYSHDGAGNRADVVVNGSRYTDKNVTIHSGRKAREIFMSIRILGQKIDRIAVTREDSDEAKLKFKAGGGERVLVLTRKLV